MGNRMENALANQNSLVELEEVYSKRRKEFETLKLELADLKNRVEPLRKEISTLKSKIANKLNNV